MDVSNVSGTVKEITFTHTVLSTPDNKIIRVPNKDVVGATIVDYSENKHRRVDLKFDISYKSDTKKALGLIGNVIESNPKILKDKDIFVRVAEHGASSINIKARVWTKSADYWTVYFDLTEAVKKTFDEQGIEIPFNQLDVHIKN